MIAGVEACGGRTGGYSGGRSQFSPIPLSPKIVMVESDGDYLLDVGNVRWIITRQELSKYAFAFEGEVGEQPFQVPFKLRYRPIR